MKTSTPVNKGKAIKFLVSLTVWNSQPCGQEVIVFFLNLKNASSDIHSAVGQLVNHFFFMVLPGMTQLTRKSSIALRLILRGSPGPTA